MVARDELLESLHPSGALPGTPAPITAYDRNR
jgi:hypothetical protein